MPIACPKSTYTSCYNRKSKYKAKVDETICSPREKKSKMSLSHSSSCIATWRFEVLIVQSRTCKQNKKNENEADYDSNVKDIIFAKFILTKSEE